MQEVLPKQAPDAVETNGKRDNIEKLEKKNTKKQKQNSGEAVQRRQSAAELQGLIPRTLKAQIHI